MIYQAQNSTRTYHNEIVIWDNFSFRAHMHRDFELIYLLDGKLEIITGERSEIMEQHQTALVFPNQVHAFRNLQSAKALVHVFSGDVVADFSRSCSNMIGDRLIFKCDKSVMDHYYDMLVQQREIEPYYFKGFLYLILGAYMKSVKLIPRKVQNMNLLDRIFDFISSHYAENITLDDVAKACGYNAHYLSKVFAANVGINFRRVINSYRIEHARHLLETTEMSVTEVAMESGFGNVRSFNRAFYNEYGISPRQLKNQQNDEKTGVVLMIESPSSEDSYEE